MLLPVEFEPPDPGDTFFANREGVEVTVQYLLLALSSRVSGKTDENMSATERIAIRREYFRVILLKLEHV